MKLSVGKHMREQAFSYTFGGNVSLAIFIKRFKKHVFLLTQQSLFLEFILRK